MEFGHKSCRARDVDKVLQVNETLSTSQSQPDIIARTKGEVKESLSFRLNSGYFYLTVRCVE